MTASRFAYIWAYAIDPRHRADFLAAYHPGGEWARLFRSDPAYLGTRLVQDAADPDRYLTIDYWSSQDARDAFRMRHRADFDALDQRCEAFTLDETFVGDFVEVVAP